MNKVITPWLVGGLLLLGVAACDDNVAKTNTNAPAALEPRTVGTPTAENAREGQEDAMSETRRQQLNSDIRAREQRDQIGGEDGDRSDANLANEVRSKLEANLPASLLTVTAEDQVVTVEGTVPTPEQLARIEPLAKEIQGVSGVNVQARVEPATPQPNAQ